LTEVGPLPCQPLMRRQPRQRSARRVERRQNQAVTLACGGATDKLGSSTRTRDDAIDPTETLNAATLERIRTADKGQPNRGLHANCKDNEGCRSGAVARSLPSVGSEFGR